MIYYIYIGTKKQRDEDVRVYVFQGLSNFFFTSNEVGKHKRIYNIIIINRGIK